MLQALLVWHASATAVLLAVYVLVAGLQWSAVRLPRLAAALRRRTAAGPVVAGATARREGEAAALTGAA